MKANMIVDIKYLPEFERRAKKMAKKYRSFIEDYDKFLGSLEENPFQGNLFRYAYIKLVWQSCQKEKVVVCEC